MSAGRFAASIYELCIDAATSIYGSNPPNDRYAAATARLLFGTAAKESHLIYNRQLTPKFSGQVGGFGLWQVELETAKDLLVRYLGPRPSLKHSIARFIFGDDPSLPMDWAETISVERLAGMLWADDRTGVALARLRYFSEPAPIPEGLIDQAKYWLKHYNRYGCTKHHAESACVGQYIKAWNECVPREYAK